ncbi:nuclease-related domain-containing protein [Cytobacillus luteolus]|uniref:nuclease-related domain-containing protein n=1 Tax=Litchfieldia luteola TaxID=682179 RepID=UPI001AE64ED4|nr:nuclease-related domain-containing protein [Cytobacillus luteolus]
MIIKTWKKSIELLKLEALLRRLSKSHPKRQLVEKDYAIKSAGFRGELSLDYPLGFLPEKDYLIFHNIRLKFNDNYFQIDTLLISPKFILILESKNISGILEFDHLNKQLIRTFNDSINVYPDPVQQVKLQRFQLGSWLELNKITTIPIKTHVVVTNPNSLIRIVPRNTYYQKKIIRSTILFERIKELSTQFNNDLLSRKEIRKLSNLLLKLDTPLNPDILKTYQINPNDLVKGVHCPSCDTIPMARVRGSFLCPQCTTISKDAYLASLSDYALLVKPTITNTEMREFLLIHSASIVKKMLATLNLSYTGTTKDRRYHLPSNE